MYRYISHIHALLYSFRPNRGSMNIFRDRFNTWSLTLYNICLSLLNLRCQRTHTKSSLTGVRILVMQVIMSEKTGRKIWVCAYFIYAFFFNQVLFYLRRFDAYMVCIPMGGGGEPAKSLTK